MSAAAAAADSKKKCPACSTTGTFDETSGICSNCGYASGEANRCPHCKAVARIEVVGESAVCAMCGGPRVPGNRGGDKAAMALREQKKHLGAARLASVATVVQAMFALTAGLIGLAINPTAIIGKLIVFAIAAIPMILALRSRSRAKATRAKAKDAGERAWQAAAQDIAADAKNGITAPALAKKLGIDDAHAERLLTNLAVTDHARIDVDSDAEVRYSVAPTSPREDDHDEENAKLRVGGDDPELEAAIEEAVADAEAAAAAKKKEHA